MNATMGTIATDKRKKRIWLWAVILALVFFAVAMHGIHIVDPKKIETAIDQNLGPKSDAADIRRFMDTHHILYIGTTADPPRIYGKIYRSSIGLMQGHILLEFDLNKNGKLVSHTVVEHLEFLWE
jgi:hypothetical protein